MNALTLVKKNWLLLLIGLVMAILIIGFLMGYRLGTYGLPVKAGTLVIENVPDGTSVFVDGTRQHVVSSTKNRVLLTPGSHSIIVDSGTNYPWNELITITSDTETQVTPVLVSTSANIAQIGPDRTAEATRALAVRALPTKQAPLKAENECVNVYVAGNRIVGEASGAEGCTVPPYLACTEEAIAQYGTCPATVIFEPGDRLESVLAYPGRGDAIIVASGNLVYVLELDPREPRFFAPLLKGPNIRAASWSPTSIIVTGTKGPREISL